MYQSKPNKDTYSCVLYNENMVSFVIGLQGNTQKEKLDLLSMLARTSKVSNQTSNEKKQIQTTVYVFKMLLAAFLSISHKKCTVHVVR